MRLSGYAAGNSTRSWVGDRVFQEVVSVEAETLYWYSWVFSPNMGIGRFVEVKKSRELQH